MKSLKVPSRVVKIVVTVIFAVLTTIATMTPEGLAAYLPQEFAGCAAIIISFAGAIVDQYAEEKRVVRAEELAVQQAATVLGAPMDGGIVLNDEYTTTPDDPEEDSGDGC